MAPILLPNYLHLLIACFLESALDRNIEFFELGSQPLIHGKELVDFGVLNPLLIHLSLQWAPGW